jgi:hypothetical protein
MEDEFIEKSLTVTGQNRKTRTVMRQTGLGTACALKLEDAINNIVLLY